MTAWLSQLLSVSGPVVYAVVALFVFAEDAIFVGFVVPGETAAVLGGVVASRGQVDVRLMAGTVVLSAIAGDSVGYEIGRRIGPRVLGLRILRRHRSRLDDARSFLARRGGRAVFLGRFVAFFRAVMPALAGMSRMRYLRFLAFNAAGGLAWGTGFVLLGYLAGNSYARVERTVGRGAAVTVAVLVVLALVVHHLRRRHRSRRDEQREGDEDRADRRDGEQHLLRPPAGRLDLGEAAEGQSGDDRHGERG
ncbi:MAG: DedA family protein [Actinomycetes bacterium]